MLRFNPGIGSSGWVLHLNTKTGNEAGNLCFKQLSDLSAMTGNVELLGLNYRPFLRKVNDLLVYDRPDFLQAVTALQWRKFGCEV